MSKPIDIDMFKPRRATTLPVRCNAVLYPSINVYCIRINRDNLYSKLLAPPIALLIYRELSEWTWIQIQEGPYSQLIGLFRR